MDFNITYNQIKGDLEKKLSKHRLIHSLNVEKKAIELSNIYNCCPDRVRLAAIAHDLAKHFSDIELLSHAREFNLSIDNIQLNSPQLLHGPIATYLCKYTYNIMDEDILNAIYYHTTGRSEMSLLEKIIYLADVIEDGRNFPGVDEIRLLSRFDMDRALILSCNSTLSYILKRNELIHPLTIELRNSLLLRSESINGH